MQKASKSSDSSCFGKKVSFIVSRHLKDNNSHRSHYSLVDADEDVSSISSRAQRLIISLGQLYDKTSAAKKGIDQIVAEGAGHHLIVTIGAQDHLDYPYYVPSSGTLNQSLGRAVEHLPEEVRALTLRDPHRRVDKFSNHCLRRLTLLQAIDLSHLRNITSIGKYFIKDCRNLTSLDLQGFEKVKFIDADFLSGCAKLTHFDLSPLTSLVSMKACYLKYPLAMNPEIKKIRNFLEERGINYKEQKHKIIK